MKDITGILNNYRECSRVLRNNYFRSEGSADEALALGARFKDIDSILFRALVLWNINQQSCHWIPGEPLPFLRVAPSSTGIAIQIERRGADGACRWDDPINRIMDLEADFRYIGYHDRPVFGYADFRYYHVRVVAYPTQPQVEGQNALIEVPDARVFLLEGE